MGITHLGVLPSGLSLRVEDSDSVVNIFYPIIAISADVSEDVPYLIIFMKACTKVKERHHPPCLLVFVVISKCSPLHLSP